MSGHEIDLERLRQAAEAMRQDRQRRDVAWASAEGHIAEANDCQRLEAACTAASMEAESQTAAERLRERAALWRRLGLAHLGIALTFAQDAGIDTSSIAIPEE